ncbi:MAG: hypothetical protein GMKNLPBB_02955 [Myxococcota bacterium]|nr:hypothetical protein [Myxococcota bacterium]
MNQEKPRSILSSIRAVAWFEFSRTIRRTGYWLSTIGFPLLVSVPPLMIFLTEGGAHITRMAKEAPVPGRVVVLDESGVLGPWVARRGGADPVSASAASWMSLRDPRPRWPREMRWVSTIEEGQKMVRDGEAEYFVHISRDFLISGSVSAYVHGQQSEGLRNRGDWIESWMARAYVEDKVTPDVMKRLIQSASIRFVDLKEAKEVSLKKKIQNSLLSTFVMVFFLLSIFSCSGYLLSALEEEKENRVFELLMTHVRAEELMWGKLLGLGAAGMLQVILWGAAGLAAATAFARGGFIPPMVLFFALPFFILGFFLYGGLMIGTGALGRTGRQSQQLAAMWAAVAVMPVILANPMVHHIQPLTARVMTYFPLTSPVSALSMWSEGHIESWELLLSLAILAASCHVVIRTAARLLRTAWLMQGKEFDLREVWRWYRESGDG